MKNLKNVIVVMFLISSSIMLGQNSGSDSVEKEIDASKPTNFYSMVDNTMEYSSQPGQNVFGYRGKFTMAISESNLLLAEVPVLYNDRTKKVGMGDLRARYFYLPYKNYDKFVGAFGGSVDVFAPTGSLKDGLGSGRLVVSPGLTVGLMASESIQFFPIISYQYSSKIMDSGMKFDGDKATSGLSFQVITPIVFSEKFFVQVTPVIKINDFSDNKSARFEQEFFAAYSLTPKLQLTGFYNGKFQDKVHTVSAGLTMFL